MEKCKIISLTIALFVFQNLYGQNIIDNTRYFYLIPSISSPHSFAYVDSVRVSYSGIDTVRFSQVSGYYLIPDKEFLKCGDKIFKISATDTFLMYDYSLIQGDTFLFKDVLQKYTFLVDSVVSITLDDGNSYKHWFLKVSEFPDHPEIVWIESLGEKYAGWDYSNFKATDQGGIKAICHNNDLVFWNTEYNGFEPHNPAKTCDFGYLLKLVGIEDDVSASASLLYPNPAGDYLFLNIELPFEYRILNITGKEMMKGCASEYISVSDLTAGLFFIQISTGNVISTHKFLKN